MRGARLRPVGAASWKIGEGAPGRGSPHQRPRARPFPQEAKPSLSPPKQRDTLLPPDPCLSRERRDRSPLDSRGTRSGTASSTGSTRLGRRRDGSFGVRASCERAAADPPQEATIATIISRWSKLFSWMPVGDLSQWMQKELPASTGTPPTGYCGGGLRAGRAACLSCTGKREEVKNGTLWDLPCSIHQERG